MNRDINTLINGYLDDELTEADHRELNDWIKADPEHAARFARAVMLHDRLQWEFSAAVAEIPTLEPLVAPKVARPRRPASHVGRRVAVGILAASLLVALSVFYWQSQRDDPTGGRTVARARFATVANLVDVQWEDGVILRRGERIGTQVIAIQSGAVRLQFDDGVEVTLQGPARYELVSPDTTRLTAGLLTATVPPGAEGFRVETPTAEIIDLGTAFGVQLDEDGTSHVSVFHGEVEVALPESGEKKLVREGEAVRVETGRSIASVAFDTGDFEKIWPISSGIERSTGAFRFVPPWPPQLRFVRSDDTIFVKPEGYVATLKEPIKVNISRPGSYSRNEDLTPAEIPLGESVRSIILHYFPEQPKPPPRADRITGTITFDGPVLGLTVLREELAASAQRFSLRRAGELQPRRQLEFREGPSGDVVTLSEDRHTVTLDLAAPHHSSDLVRIIVDASQRAEVAGN
ncbi:MAG: iron dicitrate transport regulator FecR [Planctomycetaceae bacterium]|jgi:ferric-dicitrate binding protein FerR (iron transport regulator)|nr:iron dicitrate transport regulator FecR [Planctomycetaceae bacterium]